MITMPATVKNERGIHCRPSALILKHTEGYEGVIHVSAESGEADLTSIVVLLTLALECGHQLQIQVQGLQEEKMCRELVALFETEFDFPPIDDGAVPNSEEAKQQ